MSPSGNSAANPMNITVNHGDSANFTVLLKEDLIMYSSGFIMVQRDCVQQTAVQTTPLLISMVRTTI